MTTTFIGCTDIYYSQILIVVSPVITNTTTGNAGAPRFMITTDPFSDRYGGVGIYKVVVVRDNQIDPASIPDSQLRPADNGNPFK